MSAPTPSQLKREMTLLEKEIDRRLNELMRIMIEHLQYHTENEARWGLVKIMRDHPFRTIVAGMFLGMMLATTLAQVTGMDLVNWILRFFK